MNNVINIFSPNVAKEARALLDFMDRGDLEVERLKLRADLAHNSTRPCASLDELILEQLQVVEAAIKMLDKNPQSML